MRRVLAGLAVAVTLSAGGSKSARAGGFDPDPVFPVGHISATVSHQIPKLEHVASALADRQAVVNWWSNGDWARLQAWEGSHLEAAAVDAAGLTYPRTRRIQLSPYVCQSLAQVLDRSAQQPLFTSFAVTVLAHESAHLSGIGAENQAECRAIQTEPRAAMLLGISRTLARRFQHIYRGTVYPYEVPRYRTPPCAAGRPGVLAPDMLGTAANLRPLQQAATNVVRSLRGWKSIGGGESIGPLSPCAPIKSRAEELARFSETLLGPHHAVALYQATTLKTARDISEALARYKGLARCHLGLVRKHLRELHSAGKASLRPVPAAITQLSPLIKAFRVVYTGQGTQSNSDTIIVTNRASRTVDALGFEAPVGQLPVSVEVRAVSVLLQGEATMAGRSGR